MCNKSLSIHMSTSMKIDKKSCYLTAHGLESISYKDEHKYNLLPYYNIITYHHVYYN